MPLYETTFITRQDVSLQDVTKITGIFSNVLTDHGGKVVKTEQWGLRDLAYVIKKNNKAYYTMLAIEASVGALKELERRLDLNEDVLRYASIKVDKICNKPSAPMLRHSHNSETSENTTTEAPTSTGEQL